MAEIRHACEDGLTPECFAKYPRWAKKVFAYRLMHTLCPARMTKKLREALWKALIRVPVSWIPFDAFIFPPDFNWEIVFPPDWTPDDPVPLCIIVEPGAEFPADWRPGDELPPGVTIDLSQILPPYWETADPLPLGITVDPTYRIQIPQLKLMYIFIAPGETWESVFPNGWDPTGSLPDGASWNPYLVFPDYVPAKTPADDVGTTPPLYLPPWDPGPVHRPSDTPVAAEELWFNEPFDDLTTNSWTPFVWNDGTVSVGSGQVVLAGSGFGDIARITRTDARPVPANVELKILMVVTGGDGNLAFYLDNASYLIGWGIVLPDIVEIYDVAGTMEVNVGNILGQIITWKAITDGNKVSMYKNDGLIAGDITMRGTLIADGTMQLNVQNDSAAYVANYSIEEL